MKPKNTEFKVGQMRAYLVTGSSFWIDDDFLYTDISNAKRGVIKLTFKQFYTDDMPSVEIIKA